jgi:hypothetical protein
MKQTTDNRQNAVAIPKWDAVPTLGCSVEAIILADGVRNRVVTAAAVTTR